MTQFSFENPTSPAARAWLQAAAEYLNRSAPDEQRKWLAAWLPYLRDKPFSRNMTAFEKSLVIITLEKWADEITEAEAA